MVGLKIKNMKETAKEFIEMNSEDHSLIDIEGIMIEFAKLHVEAALKAKIKAMEYYHNDGYSLNEMDAFTNDSYPLENIK
jgi:hypothetical protein